MASGTTASDVAAAQRLATTTVAFCASSTGGASPWLRDRPRAAARPCPEGMHVDRLLCGGLTRFHGMQRPRRELQQ